jgi:hypothetical protein
VVVRTTPPFESHDTVADDVAIDARGGFERVGVASCAGVTRERGPNDDAFDGGGDDGA